MKTESSALAQNTTYVTRRGYGNYALCYGCFRQHMYALHLRVPVSVCQLSPLPVAVELQTLERDHSCVQEEKAKR